MATPLDRPADSSPRTLLPVPVPVPASTDTGVPDEAPPPTLRWVFVGIVLLGLWTLGGAVRTALLADDVEREARRRLREIDAGPDAPGLAGRFGERLGPITAGLQWAVTGGLCCGAFYLVAASAVHLRPVPVTVAVLVVYVASYGIAVAVHPPAWLKLLSGGRLVVVPLLWLCVQRARELQARRDRHAGRSPWRNPGPG